MLFIHLCCFVNNSDVIVHTNSYNCFKSITESSTFPRNVKYVSQSQKSFQLCIISFSLDPPKIINTLKLHRHVFWVIETFSVATPLLLTKKFIKIKFDTKLSLILYILYFSFLRLYSFFQEFFLLSGIFLIKEPNFTDFAFKPAEWS